jgi:hypothetical protein
VRDIAFVMRGFYFSFINLIIILSFIVRVPYFIIIGIIRAIKWYNRKRNPS